ncbi:secretion protein HlyD [Calothrix sp. HK-06]|nr:secretion protein HlyD [Calothrix sp. HK-06]
MQAESSNPNSMVSQLNTNTSIVVDSPIPNTTAPKKKLPVKKLLLGGLGIGLVLGGISGYNWFRFASMHEETDDAYVTADIHPVTARISGTVQQVNVNDNQVVNSGAVLVKLDPADFKVSLQQAQASLQNTKQQAEAAKENVALASQTTTAKTAQSQGDVSSSQAVISTAIASYNEAQAGVPVALAGVKNAQATIDAAKASVTQAQAGIPTAQAAVQQAQAGVQVAIANVSQAKANQVKAETDYRRYHTLFDQGVISHQQLDTTKAAYQVTVAQVQASQQGILQAQQQVKQSHESLQQAYAKVVQTKQDITKGEASLAQAKQQVTQAQERVAEAQEGITKAKAQLATSKGGLQLAATGNQQTKVSEQQYQATLAATAQQKAQVENAELQLSYTTITAPTAGQVGNKTVEVGQRVQPGQALMSIVEQKPWIIANFKETQLKKMRPGQEVEIKVDAFGGRTFQGKVDSLSPASGAKFALLPPDNATGNFTKIVQRVPVKITFDPSSMKGYESLIAPGMSAVISVNIGG